MANGPEIPTDWTEPEQWVWQRIAAGELADLNAREREHNADFEDLDPRKAEGWTEQRRLRVTFLQTILTQKAFAEAAPHGGVRILGALVDDAALDLEHARLQRLFWLERSRILVDVKGRNLRIDGEFSLWKSFVAGGIELRQADIRENLDMRLGEFHGEVDLANARIGFNLDMDGSTFEEEVSLNGATVKGGARLRGGATFKGEVDFGSASIGSNLVMTGSTYEESVSLNRATVKGTAFLSRGAIFKGEVDLVSASIGSVLDMAGATFEGEVELRGASIGLNLQMVGSTFEENVTLNSATVNGAAFLRGGATFKGEVDLGSTSIGSDLDMAGSTFEEEVSLNGATVNGAAFLRGGATFEGEVDLVGASIGSDLDMAGSTFEEKVDLSGATVNGSAFLRGGATFKGEVDLVSASIGSDLDFSAANISREVDLSGCKVTGELRLGSSEHPPATWEEGAALVLRNTEVGALQDWWRDESDNSWPQALQLEGFTYGQLGGLLGAGEEADMMARPAASYLQWLARDPSSSPQRYEHLARFFRQAGEPRKANDILYEARERRRRITLSNVDDHGRAKKRNWFEALGLWLLCWTVGYGLGRRYFRVLWWIGVLILLGGLLLIYVGQHSLASWPALFFASFDQLLPIITLDKAHDALIFGNPSAKPPVAPQPDLVRFYFYFYKIIGWVLGSFIVAGLAGLTQRS